MAAFQALQLVFELEPLHAWSEDDFYVAQCNAQAFQLIKNPQAWQSPAAVIYGPAGSGKSHLARIWQAEAGALLLSTSDLSYDTPHAHDTSLIVEDVDAAAFDERALFHELNLAREHGNSVLLSARTPPGQWAIPLPDLRSRIRSYPAIEIRTPDDELLAAVLVKLFCDRQLTIAPDVIPYLLPRMERSMAMAQRLVADIDRLALAQHRKITRAFASQILSQMHVAQEGGHHAEHR